MEGVPGQGMTEVQFEAVRTQEAERTHGQKVILHAVLPLIAAFAGLAIGGGVSLKGLEFAAIGFVGMEAATLMGRGALHLKRSWGESPPPSLNEVGRNRAYFQENTVSIWDRELPKGAGSDEILNFGENTVKVAQQMSGANPLHSDKVQPLERQYKLAVRSAIIRSINDESIDAGAIKKQYNELFPNEKI